MDSTALLDQAYAWTSARIVVVSANGLDDPTPCSRWSVQDLLDHTFDTLAMFTDTVAPPGADAHVPEVRALGSTPWDLAIAELATRSRRAWQAPGVLDRTFDLPAPMGAQPAAVVASANLLEVVVHGWDISQATGEGAAIPETLALPVLEFARQALGDAPRGDHFAADLGIGDTPSDQLVSFLGRKPR
ncbi:MAG: TIGR03086 family metal-binding protein [Acidimicrobiales bacterium]